MKNKIHQILSYITYFIRAKTIYGIDSPVLYAFFNSVLDDKREYYAFRRINQLRSALKTNFTRIKRTDFGTGKNEHTTTVSNIYNTSASSKLKGELLFRLVKWFKPKEIIELGTNLGISTAYLASVHTKTMVNTIEADPLLSQIAEENLHDLQLTSVRIINGTFENELTRLLSLHPDTNFFFIDGNHAFDPTLAYTRAILCQQQTNFLIIYDDIYWSTEMTKAWNELKNNKEFNFIIDIYHFGIVGHIPDLRKPIRKTLISTKKKIWQMGFFR